MRVVLDKVSKRFSSWLFREFDYSFTSGQSYAVTGANGSGKSTLLKIISGMIPCNSGSVTHYVNQVPVDMDSVYQHLSFVAPYMEVPEELTLTEFLEFHFKLKPISPDISIAEAIGQAGLESASHKPIHTFSSGMKQRTRLILGLYGNAPLLLLDEPSTNLDESGADWYQREIRRVKAEKLLIVGSNLPTEYSFCDQVIQL